jgi:hypothetical protein
MSKNFIKSKAKGRLDYLLKDLEQGHFLVDMVVTIMKDECIGCIKREFSLLRNYEDVVDAIARNTNQLYRFSVDGYPVATHVKLLALAWYYAEKEYMQRDLESYEFFVECLRTDVYVALYRRVDGYYGYIEPRKIRK